jgi:succinyl-CoA synthetase beta subunit
VLVNIFGGIVRCDLVARGIVAALGGSGLRVPFVVRFHGTNADEGKAVLAASGLSYATAETMAEAAAKAVDFARGGGRA